MSNSKMDTWPLKVRSMVERKAKVVGPDSMGWQVLRRDSNSAQGSTHLGGRWGAGCRCRSGPWEPRMEDLYLARRHLGAGTPGAEGGGGWGPGLLGPWAGAG